MQGVATGILLARDAAEHCVDKAALGREAPQAGQHNRFIHHRVIRNAIEEQQLIHPHLQDATKHRTLRTAIRARGDHVIQSGAISQHPKRNLPSQATVSLRERKHAGNTIQTMFQKIARFFALKEDLQDHRPSRWRR